MRSKYADFKDPFNHGCSHDDLLTSGPPGIREKFCGCQKERVILPDSTPTLHSSYNSDFETIRCLRVKDSLKIELFIVAGPDPPDRITLVR